MTPEEVADRLAAFLKRSHNARSVRINNLRLLTGGASRPIPAHPELVEGSTPSRTIGP